MRVIFIGILLIMVNLDIGIIDYFLPALGLMVIYTRLRRYRGASRSFVQAQKFVTAMLLCETAILFLIATPLNLSDAVNCCMMIGSTALQACFLFCLMKGVQEEYRRRGDLEFKGSSVIGLVAAKALLILFFIADFKLGTAICGLAMLVFLAGLFGRLQQADRDLKLPLMAKAAGKSSDKVLWGGYALLTAAAVFGGMYLGTVALDEPHFEQSAPSVYAERLTEKGMPEAVARDLSAEDAKSLGAVKSFMEIKGNGGKSVKARLIAGMTGKYDYKLVLWYGDLGGERSKGCLSREIIEVSRTEDIASCAGLVYYTKGGKEFSERITASKVDLNQGKILLREIKDVDVAQVFYAQIPLRNGADRVRGYLMLDGRFDGEGTDSSVYTELYDAKIIQFPYKNEKQTAVLADKKGPQRSCTFILPYGFR